MGKEQQLLTWPLPCRVPACMPAQPRLLQSPPHQHDPEMSAVGISVPHQQLAADGADEGAQRRENADLEYEEVQQGRW